jgi:hypothetical protein
MTSDLVDAVVAGDLDTPRDITVNALPYTIADVCEMGDARLWATLEAITEGYEVGYADGYDEGYDKGAQAGYKDTKDEVLGFLEEMNDDESYWPDLDRHTLSVVIEEMKKI